VRKTSLAIVGIAALVATAVAQAGVIGDGKIDSRLRERPQSEAVIPVFIVLAHQPQYEIMRRAEGPAALRRQLAESGYQAREAADAIVLETRREAFQAIERAIGPEQDALEARLKKLGAGAVSRYLGINMITAEIPPSALAALQSDPSVARVFPAEKNDPQLATSVPDLGAPAFWNAGYTGQGEAVGILDSGAKTNHPAFAGMPLVSQVFLDYGRTDPCFGDYAGSAEDQLGHGTHVAGIVASQGAAGWTNYQGVAKGISTLYVLKVSYKVFPSASCGTYGKSDQRDMLAALDWAVRNTPLRIFNYSWGIGATADDDGFAQAVDQYIDSYGLTIAFAAGNGGPAYYPVISPAIAYNAIAVSNWASRGVINTSTSRGPTYGGRPKPDLAAPGTNVFSAAYTWDAIPGTADDFASGTGTSMAAPHIAGAAALLTSAGVQDPLAIKAILINTTDNTGWLPDQGFGFTNLNRALAELHYATGSLTAGASRLYRISGDPRATLTWNRHVLGGASYFNRVSLRLYGADDGVRWGDSGPSPGNVQEVFGASSGADSVVAVSIDSPTLAGVSAEPFALALNGPWSSMSGPRIGLSCGVPAPIPTGSQFSIRCTATNSGDLPAVITGTMVPADGFTWSGTDTPYGTVQPGSSASASFSGTALVAPGNYALRATVTTGSFSVTPATVTTSFTAMVVDAGCTYALDSSGATVPAAGGAGSIGLAAGPNCPWAISNAPVWMTLAGPASGVGNVSIGYAVAPNEGGLRSTTLTVAGLSFDVQQLSSSAGGLRFVPVTPCRVADTRGSGGAMGAAETRSFAIPQSGCGIPSTAQAYSLNVTVVPQGPLSFLTLWPAGQDKPLVSTLNSFGGIVVANAAIVPAGFNGAVSVYVTNPTDVILDVNGYFDSPGTYAFYPVRPCRVADTRGATGPFGGPSLTGAQSRDFPIPSSSCGLPATASAYSMNVTVVPGGYLGYLKTWPTGQAQPNVSTLNSWTGKVVANAALVPAGSGGSISVYAQDPTQVVLDTNGYFGAPGGAGSLSFHPVAPCRIADTRGGQGPFGGPEIAASTARSFPIPSSGCGIPATAAAYSLNVTVVPDGMLQYLTAWPTGSAQPNVSTLNSWDGTVVANAAIVPAGDGGAISVFVTNRTHVILDINGYFAP